MFRTRKLRSLPAFLIILVLHLSPSAFAFQKQKKEAPTGSPVLWREPTDIASRNLLLGPGGEKMKPDLSRITFVREETGGFSTKFRVSDGAGKIWVAKLGKEAQPETSSVRLLWAAGYVTEVSYLVPCVQIEGAPDKKVERCEGKGFANVRFEARPKEWKRLDNWSWQQNAFTKTKEFQGLVVMMALLNNWDLKESNNRIIHALSEDGQGELRHVVSDLGATLGKTGNFISRSRNDAEDFAKAKFIEKVEAGKVYFKYTGKSEPLFDNITVEQAKWVGDILSRLSEQQIVDAFRAANYSSEEVQMLAGAMRKRIAALVALPAVTAS
jgi:hypothetical protein